MSKRKGCAILVSRMEAHAMWNRIESINVASFLEGDLRLEGTCVFQGRITAIGRDGRTLSATLAPLAEKAADGKRWVGSRQCSWDLVLTISYVLHVEQTKLVAVSDLGEQVTLFAKGHVSQLAYEELSEHDIQIGSA